MRQIIIIIVSALLFGFHERPGQLRVSVQPVFNGEPIVLSKRSYITSNNDTITLETFRFYLSNFSAYANKKWNKLKNTYFLIDAEKNESKNFFLNVDGTKVDSISFFIGVDSLMSVSGALDGALDPTLGMYWAWNTGYINAKLEGKSNSCNTLHHAFEFHIGGYLSPYSSLKKVTIATSHLATLNLKADAAKWFYGSEKIDLKHLNSVVFPCEKALLIADNYKNMFSEMK